MSRLSDGRQLRADWLVGGCGGSVEGRKRHKSQGFNKNQFLSNVFVRLEVNREKKRSSSGRTLPEADAQQQRTSKIL